jgi:hypothetical protein
MASSAPSTERATYRTVVLLRKSEKLTLERLAANQNISSAEVLRRLIREGDSFFQDKHEEEVILASLNLISTAAREANESMARTMARVDKLHEELMEKNPA